MINEIFNIWIYEGKGQRIIFELDIKKVPYTRFLRAKYQCNSRYLKHEICAHYIFDKDHCRVATEEEVKEYLELKKEKLK